MKNILNFVKSIEPCGMSHLQVNGYYFEWKGNGWKLVKETEPVDQDFILDI